ncbi:MAG: PKD domain-containing protein [Rhizobacter sp.]
MKNIHRTYCGLALVLALCASAWSAGPPNAVVPHVVKPHFPRLNLLEHHSGGQRAIDGLGSRLPEVAEWYGKSPDEFRGMLLNDRRVRLDQRGRVFIVEELDRPLPVTPALAADTSLLDGALLPLDQTFLLHSRAGARRTIYLNFKGATLSGTAWNGTGGSIIAPPYDVDGIPYTFSTTELQRIQYIWQRVAEDYAPFDVDVTTEAVAPDLLTRSSGTDGVFGTTVLITKSTGVYSCSCGGVAYLGVFDDTSEFYKPALVFYDALGGGNEKYVAEAISHEAGHNMGLGHDGTATATYYQGQGSGATGWAPIMGVGYYQQLVQWSKGEYTGANNVQDDYAVMQSNGLTLRNDDHGDNPGTATVLAGTASGGMTAVAARGVIERPTDVDFFAFTAAPGTATFTVTPAARSSNLDAWVGLRDAGGNVLASINPVDALNASFSVNLPVAGTYYLSVQGTGKGDPRTTGYSAYGSLGQYAVNGSFFTPGSQSPTAVISASKLRGTAPLVVAFSGASSFDPDGSLVAYDWTFGDGTGASGATASHTYSVPGSFSAMLRVTDNSGLSTASAVTITVDAPVAVSSMRVSSIAMGLTVSRTGLSKARAAVKVLGSNGLPVVGATVAGTWSGLVASIGSAVTDSTGVAVFTSLTTRSTGGSFVFTVNSVGGVSGYTYAPLTNTETSDSIAR